MSDVTIKQLAKVLGTPIDKLLAQLAEAGMKFTNPDQVISSTEKVKLLGFLRRTHGKHEAPVETAVVYLKNLRTQDITTHLSEKDGQFRFSGLDLNVDYEIHAEREGWTSSSHSVSNFDNRKEYVLTLRLDHKKAAK